MIYLIGRAGAATTNDDGMAIVIEQTSSYRRCTKDEYYEHLRKIRGVDTPARIDEENHNSRSPQGDQTQ